MRYLPRNESTLDRVVRIVIGLALLSVFLFGPRNYWGLLGIVPLMTGVLGSCPLYTLFGFQTCPTKASGAA